MFNEELKKNYIIERNSEVVLPNNYLERLFANLSKYEKELEKDICDFTTYEILEYYKILNTSSFESLIVMNSQLSNYTQWCLQQNMVKDNQNHFIEITLEQIKNCVNKVVFERKIVNRSNLLKWCDELPNPKDQFILLALFEGIKGKDFCEIAKLKPEDIEENIARLCTNRSIEISDKLAKIIHECLREDKYYSISGKGVKEMTLVYNGYIVKDYPNVKDDVSEFQIGRKIYNSIIRSLSYVGVSKFVSANSIFESGKIYMIKNRAKELNISPKEYIYSPKLEEVEEKYNSKITRSTFWLKYKEYLV